MQQLAKIDQAGRLVIPASYRKALDLHVGDKLILQLKEGEIRLFRQSQALENIRKAVKEKGAKKISHTDDFLAFRKKDSE